VSTEYDFFVSLIRDLSNPRNHCCACEITGASRSDVPDCEAPLWLPSSGRSQGSERPLKVPSRFNSTLLRRVWRDVSRAKVTPLNLHTSTSRISTEAGSDASLPVGGSSSGTLAIRSPSKYWRSRDPSFRRSARMKSAAKSWERHREASTGSASQKRSPVRICNARLLSMDRMYRWTRCTSSRRSDFVRSESKPAYERTRGTGDRPPRVEPATNGSPELPSGPFRVNASPVRRNRAPSSDRRSLHLASIRGGRVRHPKGVRDSLYTRAGSAGAAAGVARGCEALGPRRPREFGVGAGCRSQRHVRAIVICENGFASERISVSSER